MFGVADVAALSSGAQLLYVKLLSEPTLSHAGVCGLTEGRWANQSADTDRAGTEAGLAELQAARLRRHREGGASSSPLVAARRDATIPATDAPVPPHPDARPRCPNGETLVE